MIAVGLLVVAAVFYLLGHHRGRRAAHRSPVATAVASHAAEVQQLRSTLTYFLNRDDFRGAVSELRLLGDSRGMVADLAGGTAQWDATTEDEALAHRQRSVRETFERLKASHPESQDVRELEEHWETIDQFIDGIEQMRAARKAARNEYP